MLPPILEIYAIWHPEDEVEAKPFFDALLHHFRGTPFSGLIGGAVEVYHRSHPWDGQRGAPRPIIFPTEKAGIVEPPRIVVLVPIIGFGLDAALVGKEWHDFVQSAMHAEKRSHKSTQIFPALLLGCKMGKKTLALLGSHQLISQRNSSSGLDHAATCRDLVQGIVQRLRGDRIKVFISHTKRAGEMEDIEGLVKVVRDVIASTRLQTFFDAQDIQPGDDWSATIVNEASSSAMLAIRTDLYPSREWCQREMLVAKTNGLPVVTIDSVGHSEERGSFLMDHIARVAVIKTKAGWDRNSIMVALNLLVDECLKRELWKQQQLAAADRVDLKDAWWAPHAPEPITLVPQLEKLSNTTKANLFRILHPDPPLGYPELQSLQNLSKLAGVEIDVMTPRQYAARGGD
jgi:TIR domain